MIEITSTGGFSGMGSGIHKQVDVDQAATDLRTRLCEAFDPESLKALERRTRSDRAADMFTYKIVVTDPEMGRQEFNVREDALPPETLDLIDEMQGVSAP